MVFFFLFQVDGADVGCGSSGHGSAAVWPGESGWVWLRPAAPAGPSSLLRGHTYGCYEGTGEWINSDTYCPVREYLWLVFNVYIQVVHDVSAEKLFLRDLVAAGAVTDLTGALGVSRAESDDIVATPWTLTFRTLGSIPDEEKKRWPFDAQPSEKNGKLKDWAIQGLCL